MYFINVIHQIEITFWTVVIAMMRNRRALRMFVSILGVLILAAIIILVGGALGRLKFSSVNRRVSLGLNNTIVGSILSSSHRQYNTLVVLVDRQSSDQDIGYANIEGIWLAAYLISDSKLNLVPVTIDNKQSPKNRLQFTSEEILTEELFQTLHAKGVNWDHYVVVDIKALRKLIEQVSENNPGMANVNYEIFVGDLQVAEAIYYCKNAIEIFQDKKTSKLLEDYTGLYYTDLRKSKVDAFFRDARYKTGYSCEFPTLQDKDSGIYFTQK